MVTASAQSGVIHRYNTKKRSSVPFGLICLRCGSTFLVRLGVILDFLSYAQDGINEAHEALQWSPGFRDVVMPTMHDGSCARGGGEEKTVLWVRSVRHVNSEQHTSHSNITNYCAAQLASMTLTTNDRMRHADHDRY
ncbi:hypothetical protein HBI56_056650 [Parastagonospora nodorum]|uniref:Uncharacterized protein n=1 Tax=Phaeosphaeria nodorum (strain SN15 / ATCC MYA-4574 / FGSC 10173) TaxID=321614 RepID=A0A7U2NQY2_PHANO|nr:hypothetical protein HBH56_095460 [Parastagonospora nodorum]QRD07169.1 hypothetical protein JI435_308360 [Parastagonospora nodorum SN15]KAH3930425.1 hypothetical protein HBH54_109780 [Parastagonospora nodorum]KAH3945050.1 hypothetical protein HBH53_149650 [Parastagonospora nodorum]KAH3966908.1 hypothetical protein HBH51_141060 [Parastagonospora nodorum]